MSENNLEPGDSIAGYRILHKIGEGGYGVVFAAADPSGERVAIKILRPELAGDASIRERISREVAALSAVSSDRVAKIIASNLDGDQPLIVMEFVEGLTLEQHVRARGSLTGAMATSVALAIAEGLLEVHRSGIVHRDLKPSNIMIGPDGVKILDFGIASLAEANDFTRTGTVLGSTIWMSPEQIAGDDVGTSSDVFALGLVLAFALIGEHPYGKGRPEALMYRIDQGAPNLSVINGPLRPIVEALLQRKGSDRPRLEDVISHLNGSNSSNEFIPSVGDKEAQKPSEDPPIDRTTVLQNQPLDTPIPEGNSTRRKILIGLTALLLLANGIIWPIYLGRSPERSSLIESLPIETSVAAAPNEGTEQPPAKTTTSEAISVATTSVPRISTTTQPIQVAPTTVPPPPVYRLRKFEGYTLRWNPCQNPITILINDSNNELNGVTLAAVGQFLNSQALELSDITGHLILYQGLTDETAEPVYKNGEKIIIEFSNTKEPLNFTSWDRTSGTTAEVDSVQIRMRSFLSTTADGELTDSAKKSLMFHLGLAFGLEELEAADFTSFGITESSARANEIMYWINGSRRSTPAVWGPGDRIGMMLAQNGGCF